MESQKSAEAIVGAFDRAEGLNVDERRKDRSLDGEGVAE